MKPLVYLGGPISGLDFDGATDWRVRADNLLSPHGIKTLNPLRYQEHLRSVGTFTNAAREAARLESPMSMPKGLTIRDKWDAKRCNVLLVNFIGAKTVSIGTVMEISWAEDAGNPVVVAIEPDGSNPHEHAMLNHCIGFRVPTLWDATDVTRQLLAC